MDLRVSVFSSVLLFLLIGTNASPFLSQFVGKKSFDDRSQQLPTTPTTRKHTGETCQYLSSECTSPRVCSEFQLTLSVQVEPCRNTSSRCVCLEPTGERSCTSSSDCLFNDRCVFIKARNKNICLSCKISENMKSSIGETVDDGRSSCNNTDSDTGTQSPSSTPSPSSSPTEGLGKFPIFCIAVSSLNHLDRSKLLYSVDKQAGVLCDHHGNCATPGHIVEHNGKIVMMATYCATVGGCVQKVKLVNSPRMKIGLRIDSEVRHLKFTALSARYETWAEEKLLQTLARFGI